MKKINEDLEKIVAQSQALVKRAQENKEEMQRMVDSGNVIRKPAPSFRKENKDDDI